MRARLSLRAETPDRIASFTLAQRRLPSAKMSIASSFGPLQSPQPMDVSLETVITQLADSGIVAARKLKGFVPPEAHPSSVEDFVSTLLKQHCLTRFQADQIAQG